MQIGAKYSHLNGEEYLLVHKPELWQEVQDVIASVDAAAYPPFRSYWLECFHNKQRN